jgi:hypothetical protein
LTAENQRAVNVYYKNQLVGNFKPDIIVDDKIIIEIFCIKKYLKDLFFINISHDRFIMDLQYFY